MGNYKCALITRNLITLWLRIITYYTEPTKQVLIQSGNALWNYEIAQLPPTPISFQDTAEGVLVNEL